MIWESIELILAFSTAIATLVVGFIVWFGEKRNYLRVPFLVLASVVALWIITNVLFFISVPQHLFFVALLSYAAAMLVAVQTFYFVLRLVRQRITVGVRIAIGAGYSAAIVAALPGVVGANIEGMAIVTRPFGIVLYGGIILFFLIGACMILLSKRRGHRVLRRQAQLILVGIATSSIFGILFNLILPAMGNYAFIQLGPASAIFFIGTVAYAIARYSLFDVRIAILRAIAYAATLSVLVTFYLLVAALVAAAFNNSPPAPEQTVVTIITALIMAMLLQPIKHFFDKMTAKVFYKDNYDTSAFFATVNKTLSASTDLRHILEQTATVISQTLKAEQMFFYVALDEDHYLFAGTENHTKIAVSDVRTMIESGATVTILRADDLSLDESIRRLLMSYNVAVAIPVVREKVILGYMLLGDKRSGDYTRRDLRLLQAIVDELVIAIQKATAVEQVKELNAHLEQRIDTATRELRHTNAQLHKLDEAKDEFISMASHQLRTPLTSIKGYISMLMEGDVGSITKEQEHLLREAFISSERMVRLIGDFLNVSRLQTGKFMIDRHPVDISQLVKNEIEGLSPSAAARSLTFEYQSPKNLPLLQLDENKIQQVVMNFADNAIYYSKENSVIKISLRKTKQAVEFTVTDTGIGVPKDQQSKLFSKFFRASNARLQRPDGTGVGLFLAKKVIDAHKGEIIFTSKEGKGSTFGFRLPLETK